MIKRIAKRILVGVLILAAIFAAVTAELYYLMPPAARAQTNTFCASNLACTVTALWTFSNGLSVTSINGGIVFADQYCANSPTLDQTCIQNALAAIPNGGTVVARPGQIYSINSCGTDANSTWGVLIDNLQDIHLEGWGATLLLNVNNNSCRVIDIRGSRQIRAEGFVFNTNFQGIGTAIALHRNVALGKNLENNTIANNIIGLVGQGGKGFNLGIDNGGTDGGQSLETQIFDNNRFYGNNTDIIQQGVNMTDQLYIAQAMSDDSTTSNITHVKLLNGDASFYRTTCNITVSSTGSNTCWLIGSGAGKITIDDIHSEDNQDRAPYLIDQGSLGIIWRGGQIIFLAGGGTVGSPIVKFDLSAASVAGSYDFYSTLVTTGTGAYKAFKLPSGTQGPPIIRHGNRWPIYIVTSNQANAVFAGDDLINNVYNFSVPGAFKNIGASGSINNFLATSFTGTVTVDTGSAGLFLRSGLGLRGYSDVGVTQKYFLDASSGQLMGTWHLSNQGTVCTNGELALSAGWQSTGAATVTAVAGNGQTCSWTITTGTTTAANPTVTDTLTNTLPNATTKCWMIITGGTHTAVAGEYFNQTTLSATAPVFTSNFTPTAGGTTYFVTRGCGP